MSGTSLDGIDVALLHTDGEDVVKRGPSATYAYRPEQQALLQDALEEAKALTDRTARPGILGDAERALTGWHADAVQKFVKDNGLSDSEIDVIGFHGQTVIHRPEMQLTVQLGDGPALARRLGRPVMWDMRAADVAAGGQGAPLVPVYHRALAASLPERPVAFLNIGGVANVSWIGRNGELIAFDTGPGNALLNDWCLKRIGRPFDEDGRLAATGKIDESALAQLLGNPYFEDRPPKSLDRNSFASLPLGHLSDADGAATLLAFTKFSVMQADDWFPEAPRRWIVCGGGRLNRTLMESFPGRPTVFQTAEEAGFNGDSMEAEAWAYLAVRCLKGLPITFPGTTGCPEPLSGGLAATP
ncbi:anhydro-N-acetylmuramic acid kinase [Aestuariivirga sp.]|uniref:anhydro-N-acetylmuramic acid kinase n=1 Tax=Aestuariivirga sp. TaxID=2650926 RepID=UPI0035943769